MMGEIKDILYIGGVILAWLVAISGFYWKTKLEIKSLTERQCDLESQMKDFMSIIGKVNRKQSIVARNLVKLMEKHRVKPVMDLFDEEDE